MDFTGKQKQAVLQVDGLIQLGASFGFALKRLGGVWYAYQGQDWIRLGSTERAEKVLRRMQ